MWQSRCFWRVSVAALALCSSVSLAQQPFFTGLGDLPGGPYDSSAWAISPDASTIVGMSYSADFADDGSYGEEAFRWTPAGGMVGLGGVRGLPDSLALGASNNGNVIAGRVRLGSMLSQAFRWSADDGMALLGNLPGGVNFSVAHGISADGDVIVGFSSSANGFMEAFRWTESAGLIGLGDLAGGPFRSAASAVSADGSVIVGFGSVSETGSNAFRWTETEGLIELGDLPGGSIGSSATGVSTDGSTAIGVSSSFALLSDGFRWTETGGMVRLGDYPGGSNEVRPMAVSGDGSTIVGHVTVGEEYFVHPFIWNAEHGVRALEDVLASEFDLQQVLDWNLAGAYGISSDGRTIVGSGINPEGLPEAWVAHIPEPAMFGWVVAAAFVMVARRRRVFA